MSEIDFEGDPIWQVDIEHRNPGASPIWSQAFNAIDEETAKRKSLALFEGAGLNVMLIDRITIWPLIFPEGSENGERPGTSEVVDGEGEIT